MKKIVKALDPNSHIFMPVQSGFGAPDLDLVISIQGFSLRIETKVDRKKPSPRQLLTIGGLDAAKVPVLLIDQFNLLDVAITVDYLLTGKQATALWFARGQREDYLER